MSASIPRSGFAGRRTGSGKDRPEVCHDGRARALANTAALLAALSRHRVAAIGLEAGGGFERRAAQALLDADHRVRRVDPCRVRQFAKACGRLSGQARPRRERGADPIDAAMIARYLAAMTARGKPKTVGVVALLRTRAVALNATLKHHRPWHDPRTPLPSHDGCSKPAPGWIGGPG